jgi:hypothetical protein
MRVSKPAADRLPSVRQEINDTVGDINHLWSDGESRGAPQRISQGLKLEPDHAMYGNAALACIIAEVITWRKRNTE